MPKIGAAIPICEQDKDYLETLLNEIERMDIKVSWLANNCSSKTLGILTKSKRTIGLKVYNGSFHNCLRQYPLDNLRNLGYDWCIQWDADETWAKNAPARLREILKDQKLIQVRMCHVWEKNGKNYVTTDWASERDRIYNLKYDWFYKDRVVAGATLFNYPYEPKLADLWMIHWGYSTPEKRRKHKTRWDTNHGHSVGKNPYGMWDTINQPNYEPKLIHMSKFEPIH